MLSRHSKHTPRAPFVALFDATGTLAGAVGV